MQHAKILKVVRDFGYYQLADQQAGYMYMYLGYIYMWPRYCVLANWILTVIQMDYIVPKVHIYRSYGYSHKYLIHKHFETKTHHHIACSSASKLVMVVTPYCPQAGILFYNHAHTQKKAEKNWYSQVHCHKQSVGTKSHFATEMQYVIRYTHVIISSRILTTPFSKLL